MEGIFKKAKCLDILLAVQCELFDIFYEMLYKRIIMYNNVHCLCLVVFSSLLLNKKAVYVQTNHHVIVIVDESANAKNILLPKVNLPMELSERVGKRERERGSGQMNVIDMQTFPYGNGFSQQYTRDYTDKNIKQIWKYATYQRKTSIRHTTPHYIY